MNQHNDSIDEEISNDIISDSFYLYPQLLVAESNNQRGVPPIKLLKHTIGADTKRQNKRRRINKLKYQAQFAYDTVHRIKHTYTYCKSIWLNQKHTNNNIVTNTTTYNYTYRPVPDTVSFVFCGKNNHRLLNKVTSPPRLLDEGRFRVIISFWNPHTRSLLYFNPKFFKSTSDDSDSTSDDSDSSQSSDSDDNNSEN
jgi:hypothetical protein